MFDDRIAINAKELAAAAGVTIMTISRAVRAGELKAYRLHPQGARRFMVEDVRAWLTRCDGNTPGPAPAYRRKQIIADSA